MYTSKYYTCEQIDERLLQGYYDDAVAHGFTGNIAEFWTLVLSISQLKSKISVVENGVAYNNAVLEALAKKIESLRSDLTAEIGR